MSTEQQTARDAEALQRTWDTDPRWAGIARTYTAEEVIRLRGSFVVEQTIARRGAERLWDLIHSEDFVAALGALTVVRRWRWSKPG